MLKNLQKIAYTTITVACKLPIPEIKAKIKEVTKQLMEMCKDAENHWQITPVKC